MSKVIIYLINKTGGDDHLCVGQLSSYFLKFVADDAIFNKILSLAGKAPRRNSPSFDMLLQDSKV